MNVRAGQDSGYFFLYETVAALTYAGDARLDVVNMSFYTDPWLFNCDVGRRLRRGHASTADEIADQAFIRSTVLAALDYATDHGRHAGRGGRQRAHRLRPAAALRRHEPRLPARHRGRRGP